MGAELACCGSDPSQEHDIDIQRHPRITPGSPSSPISPVSPPSPKQTRITPYSSPSPPGFAIAPPSSITTPAISEPVVIDADPPRHTLKRSTSSPITILYQIKEDEEVSQIQMEYQKTFTSSSDKSVHHNQFSSYFDDVDLNVAAPADLFNYFSDTSRSASFKDNTHQKTKTIFSDLGIARILSKDGSENWPLQRYVTLRTTDKRTIILDLSKFGSFLSNQRIDNQHIYYDMIWMKYDTFSEHKVDIDFVTDILSDLLHEYLMMEYVVNIRAIISTDLEKALQLIIPFIPSYRSRKGTASTMASSHFKFEYVTSADTEYEDDDEDEDDTTFTFNDFCNLGDSLMSAQEMEEDDDIEDSFIMDYWDMVQYINSHKLHVWGQVINKLHVCMDGDCNNGDCLKKQQSLSQLDTKQIAELIELVLIDYGRNGLGHDNMEVYSSQIKEYTDHLSQLFNEWVQSELGVNCKFITKKQFFEFVECIHPTKKV